MRLNQSEDEVLATQNLMHTSTILLVSCPDRKGVVARIADFIFRHGGNILFADEHGDEGSNLFLMRVEFDPSVDINLEDFGKHFGPSLKSSAWTGGSLAPDNARVWQYWFRNLTTAWWTCCTVTKSAN